MRRKPEPAKDNGLKIGDRVRLVSNTIIWKGENSLQGKIGEVVECRPEGRVSVVFDNGRLLMGHEASQFERLAGLVLKAKGK